MLLGIYATKPNLKVRIQFTQSNTINFIKKTQQHKTTIQTLKS